MKTNKKPLKDGTVIKSAASSSTSTVVDQQVFIQFADKPIEQLIESGMVLDCLSIIANDLARLINPDFQNQYLKFLKCDPEKNSAKYDLIEKIVNLSKHGIKELYQLNELHFIILEYNAYLNKVKEYLEKLDSSLVENPHLIITKKDLNKLQNGLKNLEAFYLRIVNEVIARLKILVKKPGIRKIIPDFILVKGFLIMITDILQFAKSTKIETYSQYLAKLTEVFNWMKLIKYSDRKDDPFVHNFIQEFVLKKSESSVDDMTAALQVLDDDLTLFRSGSEDFPSDTLLKQKVTDYFSKYVLKNLSLTQEDKVYCEILFGLLTQAHYALAFKPIIAISYSKLNYQINCLRLRNKPEVVTQPAYDIVIKLLCEVFNLFFKQVKAKEQDERAAFLLASSELILSITKDIAFIQDSYQAYFNTSHRLLAVINGLYLELNQELELACQQRADIVKSNITEEQRMVLTNELIQQEEAEQKLAEEQKVNKIKVVNGFLPTDETFDYNYDEENDDDLSYRHIEQKIKKFFSLALKFSHLEDKNQAIEAMSNALNLAKNLPEKKQQTKIDAAVCLAYYLLERCSFLYRNCVNEITAVFSQEIELEKMLKNLEDGMIDLNDLYTMHKGKPYRIAKIINNYKEQIDDCLVNELEPVLSLITEDKPITHYIMQKNKIFRGDMRQYFSDIQLYLTLTKVKFADIYKSRRQGCSDVAEISARVRVFEQANFLLASPAISLIDINIGSMTAPIEANPDLSIKYILKKQSEKQTSIRMSVFWLIRQKKSLPVTNAFTKIIHNSEENIQVILDLLEANPTQRIIICCQEGYEVNDLISQLTAQQAPIQQCSVFLTHKTELPLSANIKYIFTTTAMCEEFHSLLTNWQADSFVLLNANDMKSYCRRIFDKFVLPNTMVLMTGKNPLMLPRTPAERQHYINSMMLAYPEATEVDSIEDIQECLTKISMN